MERGKSSFKREGYNNTILPQEQEKSQLNLTPNAASLVEWASPVAQLVKNPPTFWET